MASHRVTLDSLTPFHIPNYLIDTHELLKKRKFIIEDKKNVYMGITIFHCHLQNFCTTKLLVSVVRPVCNEC